MYLLPIPMAARSKGRSAGIACSNPANGMDVYLLCLLCSCVASGFCDEMITRPEESYRVCVCVCVCVCLVVCASRNPNKEGV